MSTQIMTTDLDDAIPAIVDWCEADADARTELLRRPTQAVAAQTRRAVADVLDDVRTRGDDALRELTERFDRVVLDDFEVGAEEFSAAEAAVPAELREAMVNAAARIERFHAAGMPSGYDVDTADGVNCARIVRPIPRVGLYVPAGTAPLPSTALMLGVPARLAGCREVVLCTPPRPDGSADPAVLVAARLTGVHRVFKLGGAQAIAAMAFGTGRVPACDIAHRCDERVPERHQARTGVSITAIAASNSATRSGVIAPG